MSKVASTSRLQWRCCCCAAARSNRGPPGPPSVSQSADRLGRLDSCPSAAPHRTTSQRDDGDGPRWRIARARCSATSPCAGPCRTTSSTRNCCSSSCCPKSPVSAATCNLPRRAISSSPRPRAIRGSPSAQPRSRLTGGCRAWRWSPPAVATSWTRTIRRHARPLAALLVSSNKLSGGQAATWRR